LRFSTARDGPIACQREHCDKLSFPRLHGLLIPPQRRASGRSTSSAYHRSALRGTGASFSGRPKIWRRSHWCPTRPCRLRVLRRPGDHARRQSRTSGASARPRDRRPTIGLRGTRSCRSSESDESFCFRTRRSRACALATIQSSIWRRPPPSSLGASRATTFRPLDAAAGHRNVANATAALRNRRIEGDRAGAR
jgi:hypothetical protein